MGVIQEMKAQLYIIQFHGLNKSQMKKLFIITIFSIITRQNECPGIFHPIGGSEAIAICAVNHGTYLDTIKNEIFTLDTNKVNQVLLKHPDAQVDTFAISPWVEYGDVKGKFKLVPVKNEE